MQAPFATFLLVSSFGLTTVSAQPPVTAPGKSLARSADGFTQIGGLHEFADGRVLIVDFRENRVVMLDFARNTSRDITRPGEGPAELPLALTILPWFGDSVLVGGHRHALKLTSSGTVVDKLSNSFQVLPSYSAPAFADRSGRLYGSTRDALQPDPMGGFIPPLGGWVIRTSLSGGTVDSVVRLSLRDPKQVLGKPWRPYPKQDAFAVLPNGDVMVLRAQGYIAEVWRDGKLVESQRVPGFVALPIGAAERNAYRDEKLRQPAGSGRSNVAGAASGPDRQAARRALEITDDIFPPELPPFIEVRAAVVDGAKAHVWVARSFAAGSTDRLYDVFDSKGVLVRRVLLKNRGIVLGFGKGVVYVGFPDRDDVLWVEKLAEQ